MLESSIFSGLILDPFFYGVAIPSMLLFGISKGGFGGNLGIIALVMISLVVPVEQALAIMLPVLCFMDLFGLRAYWKCYDKTNLHLMIPFALVGIGLGWILFDLIEPHGFTLGIGIMGILFVVSHYVKSARRSISLTPFRHNIWKVSFYGTALGFTSMTAHAGGVPTQMYLLPQKLNKRLFVGTTVYLFIIVNYVKLIPFYFLGQLTTSNLATALVLLPIAPIGIYLGRYLQEKTQIKYFYNFCYFFLFWASIKLCYDAITYFWNHA